MTLAAEILEFWRGLGEKGWFTVDARIDHDIRARFGAAWDDARLGSFWDWQARPESALAFVILTDQFPRNMFRGQAAAFATDGLALAAAGRAIHQDFDELVRGPEREFFYMPFMHSEIMADQDRSVALFTDRLPGEANLRHAEAHRDVIRQFGRFPYRNAALGRATTAVEQAFLDAGGYASAIRARGG